MTRSAKLLRPNLFQKAMLSWNETTPYNAVHSISIQKPLDGGELLQAIRKSLSNCGFDCEIGEIEYKEVESPVDSDETLRSIFETELNLPFENLAETLPFRFFAIKTDEAHFRLGVCYFHPVASADCICWLLEDIVSTIASGGAQPLEPWASCNTHRYRRMFLSQWRFFLPWLSKLPGFLREAKCYARINGRRDCPPASRVYSLSLDNSQQTWIRDQMKATGATFNDVLISLIIYGTAKTFPRRLHHRRRKDIAIGSIINIRNHFGIASKKTFGLFLAFFSVSHSINEQTAITPLIRDVSRKTRAIKKDRLYALNLLVIGFGVFWQRFLSEQQRDRMSLRGFPLAGSVTNFFVDRYQRHLMQLPVENYWRAVSAGPATPLVISATTFRNKMNLMLIANIFIYSDDDISSLSRCLESIMSSEEPKSTQVKAVA
ncbi:MAG: hypothetical protein P1U87_04540 [Verrucomicrobiales bacterium]|nr:hypothetical protein [Verrucomicrobiales bacterium]